MFHIENGNCLIWQKDEKELYAYLGNSLKLSKSIPIIINGTGNHVHVLCIMSKNISLADLIEDIKKNSSRWIKTKDIYYRNFEWQRGYSGYSVSQSKLETVKKYILNQKDHHNKQSFDDEYRLFLQKHQIDYDENIYGHDILPFQGEGLS